MTSRLNPYISFRGNARQAMEFYQASSAAPCAEHVRRVRCAGAGPIADQIMHGMLETASGFTIMGADTPPGWSTTPATTSRSA